MTKRDEVIEVITESVTVDSGVEVDVVVEEVIEEKPVGTDMSDGIYSRWLAHQAKIKQGGR